MSEYKLVPFEPTPEMVEAAEEAYMPFGDMDLALRMVILTAPAEQQVIPNEHGKNRYGLDMSYFRQLFNRELNRPLVDFKPSELARVLARASRTADPKVMHETEFQQPTPDVALLVEALGCILSMDDKINIVDVMDSKAREMVEIARDALSAYRKGGGQP